VWSGLWGVREQRNKYIDRSFPPHHPLPSSVYPLYADYVLKNPFYEVEMPIRCELFDANLAAAVDARARRRSAAAAG
jgi:Sybindin-like family